MKYFNMSKYSTKEQLYKAKAEYYQNEHKKLVVMADKIMTDIMPQVCGLVIQDFANLNDLMMHLTEFKER